MTRLHIQVNQTIQFYRGQQGGSAPQRLFLSGGASLMPYTAQFFAEKLNVPVEYFNPFRNVQIDPAVSLEELARVAHSLGEVVGLGLRNLANCPVEMNLMPDSTLRWRALNEKKPYFIFTIFALVLVAFAVGLLFQKLAESKESQIAELKPKVNQIQEQNDKFDRAYKHLGAAKKEADQVAAWMEQRYYWGDVLAELRRVLICSENDIKKKLSAQIPGTEAGVWIEQMTTLANLQNPGGASPNSPPSPPPPRTPQAGTLPGASPNQNSTITLICRAVNLSKVDPSANSEIAYAVENELKTSPFFDPKATQLTGQITPDEANGTFTFGIIVALQNPLNL
jgi:hypothetical protein